MKRLWCPIDAPSLCRTQCRCLEHKGVNRRAGTDLGACRRRTDVVRPSSGGARRAREGNRADRPPGRGAGPLEVGATRTRDSLRQPRRRVPLRSRLRPRARRAPAYPEDDQTRLAGTATVAQVGPQRSELTLDFVPGDDTVRYRAEITSLPVPPLLVHYRGDAQQVDSLQRALDTDGDGVAAPVGVTLTPIAEAVRYRLGTRPQSPSHGDRDWTPHPRRRHGAGHG